MSVQARVDWTNVRRSLFGGLAAVAFLCIGFYFGTLHETSERDEHRPILNQLDSRVDDLEVDVFGGTASSETTSVDDLVGHVQAVDEYLTDHPRAPAGERTDLAAPPQPPSDGFTGGNAYIAERDFPNPSEFGYRMPHIVIDGRFLTFDARENGYLDDVTGVPVAWRPGEDLQLADSMQLQADECENPRVELNDIVLFPRFGDLNIVISVNPDPQIENFASRRLQAGDPIHKHAAKYLLREIALSPDRQTGIARIGKTSLWAKFEGKGDWVVADPATFPDLLKQSAGEVVHVSAK